MRVHTSLLDQYLQEGLNPFDFDYGMPASYKKVFEHKFLLKFRYRNINFDSYAMFKHYLESSIIELLPKYLQLYESENIISNPFVNYAVQDENYIRERERKRILDVARNKSYNTFVNKSAGIDVSRENTTDQGTTINAQNYDHRASDDKQNDDHIVDRTLFSDSPQSNRVDTKDKTVFNEGYVSSVTRDENRQKHLSSERQKQTGTTNNEQANSNAGSKDTYSDNVKNNQGADNHRSYQDSDTDSAFENTKKFVAQQYGLKNVTVTQILNEWRATFLNIDSQFLNELESILFLQVY